MCVLLYPIHLDIWAGEIACTIPGVVTSVIMPSTALSTLQSTGLLILRDGAISHNRLQIASDHTIHKKLHNSQKNAQNS